MKKLASIGIVTILLAISAFAGTKIVLDPYDITMQPNDIVDVSVCIEKELNGVARPEVGVNLVVTPLNNTNDFIVTAIETPTDDTGCGMVQLETRDATNGRYSYAVNGKIGSNVLVKEEGSALAIPEFGAFTALVAAGGAGMIYLIRRKK